MIIVVAGCINSPLNQKRILMIDLVVTNIGVIQLISQSECTFETRLCASCVHPTRVN